MQCSLNWIKLLKNLDTDVIISDLETKEFICSNIFDEGVSKEILLAVYELEDFSRNEIICNKIYVSQLKMWFNVKSYTDSDNGRPVLVSLIDELYCNNDENNSDLVILTDLNFNIKYINNKARDVIGITKEDFQSKALGINDVFDSNTRLEINALDNRFPYKDECTLKDKRGNHIKATRNIFCNNDRSFSEYNSYLFIVNNYVINNSEHSRYKREIILRRLLKKLSVRYTTRSIFCEAIYSSLDTASYLLEAEETSLYLFNDDSKTWNLHYNTNKIENKNAYLIPTVITDRDFNEITGILDLKGYFNVSDVSKLEMLSSNKLFAGISLKSILLIPIYSNDVMRAVAVFETFDKYREWDIDEIGFMMTLCGIIGVYFDRFDAEQLLLKAKEEAENLSMAKSAFLTTISHEIRNPVNVISGALNLIKDASEQGEFNSLIEKTDVATYHLLNLLEDLLDLSKIEAGRINFINDNYELKTVLNNICEMVNPLIKCKNLKFSYDFYSNIPDYIYGDKRRLTQVLINILNNAVKYTYEGSISFKCMLDGNSLLFIIKDTGIGIKEKDLPNIFNAFERCQDKEIADIKGTGLGLFISNKIVQAMNGSISVTSEYGKGSTFYVEIPFVSCGYKPENKEYTELSVYDAKVLIVDDNELSLLVEEKIFSLMGIKVDIAYNGNDALKLIKENKYDIIFLDYIMSGMDGIEIAMGIREMNSDYCRNVPLIALTASNEADSRKRFYESGMNDILLKPVTPEQIKDLLRRWLPKDKINN